MFLMEPEETSEIRTSARVSQVSGWGFTTMVYEKLYLEVYIINQWLECDSFVFAVYYFPWIHVRIFPVYGILVFCYEI